MNRLVMTLFFLTLATSSAYARIIRHTERDEHPRYAFMYSVHDPITKDHKQHWEARDGDLVKGAYKLLDPDGKLRVVDYWADDANGFNADVKRLGPIERPTEQKHVAVEENSEDAHTEPENAEPSPEQPASDEPKTNEISDESLKPLTLPNNYGFGSEGEEAPFGRLHTSILGTGSLRWDEKTGSYGGWVPLHPSNIPYATIFSKKYVDGKLHEWAIGPISLVGRTLVFKVKH